MNTAGMPHPAGQLTYTSFDAPGQRGGWQIKQSLGALYPVLQERLVAKALGTLDHTEMIPRFPTTDDLRDRPRRLAYGPVEAGAPGTPWAFWHAIPAGPDASGRSNVFNQMLVPSPGNPVRPALLAGSPGWLTPFGADAVREAGMSDDAPGPNPALQSMAIEFLFAGDTWRAGTLCVLVDAVVAAMAGGPPVVLLLKDMTEAPLWILLVELAMSSGTAGRLAFSTLERAADQGRWAAQGFHLVAIPAGDLSLLTTSPACLPIDPASVELSPMRGEPHRTSLGVEVADTELSALVMERFTAPSGTVDTIDMIDAMAQRVGDQDLDPRWPLAMGCWLDDAGDLLSECAEVITRTSPSAVAQHADMSEALQEALRHLGDGPDKEYRAWILLIRMVNEGRSDLDHVVQAAAGFYGELALGSPQWLGQESVRCVPPSQLSTLDTPEQRARVAGALTTLASLELTDEGSTTILQWNAILLLRSLGWPVDKQGRAARQALLAGPLAHAVTSGIGSSLLPQRLADIAGPDGDSLLRAILASDVESLGGTATPGHWLPTWFAGLFQLATPERTRLVLDAGRHGANVATQFEVAACILRSEAELVPDLARPLRTLVAKGMQTAWRPTPGTRPSFSVPQDSILVPLVARGPLLMPDLEVEPHLTPPQWLLRPLLVDPVEPPLLELMRRLENKGSVMVRALVNIRSQVWRRQDLAPNGNAFSHDVEMVMQAWTLAGPTLQRHEVPDSGLLGGVALRAIATLLLYRSGGTGGVLDMATWLGSSGFTVDVTRQAPRIFNMVTDMRRRNSLAAWTLLINTHEKSPLPHHGREGAAALGKVCHAASTPDLISEIVHAAHWADSDQDRTTMWKHLADRAETDHGVRAADTERFFRRWWRDMGGSRGAGALSGTVGALNFPWRKKES